MKNLTTKKKVLVSSIGLALLPTHSAAWFGAADFNIMDIPGYMSELLSMVQEKISEKIPAAMKGIEFKQQAKMKDIAHKAEVAMKTMPNSSACEVVLHQRGIQSALASAGQQSQKFQAKAQRTSTRTYGEATAASEKLERSKIACSPKQRETNENQCGKVSEAEAKENLMAEQYKNYGSLYGASVTLGEGDSAKSYTTGGIIPREQWMGKDYKGEEVASLVVDSMVGAPVVSMTNKVANGSARGQIYNNKASEYQARSSIIARHAADVVGDSMEMDDASAEKVKDLWLSAEVQETMRNLKGDTYNIDKTKGGGKKLNPSSMAVLEAAIVGQFNTSNAVSRALSDSKTESDLLVMNNYLLFKLFQEQRKTNDFLSALLSQSLDPVNTSSLKALRDSAEGQVISR